MPRVDFGRTRGALVDHYQAHIDRCEQCRRHPFDMCSAGQLLAGAALEEVLKLRRQRSTLDLVDAFLREVGENRIAELSSEGG